MTALACASLEMIGISGRYGTTSLAHLLAHALAQELPCEILGATRTGAPGRQAAAGPGAADELATHQLLSGVLSRGARAVAIKLGAGRLEGVAASALRLRSLVLTTLDASPDIESLARAGLNRVVINMSDPAQVALLDRLPGSVHIAGYGLEESPSVAGRCTTHVLARRVDSTPAGLRLEVEALSGWERETAALEVGLIGRGHAANVMAALAFLCSRGISLARAAREVAAARSAPGRMESFGGVGAPLVVVDSAQDPEALERALESLHGHGCRRIITVFGCDGARDESLRSGMGAAAERLSDQVILTDDNPRSVPGDRIIDDILAGMAAPEDARIQRQRGLAIRLAIALAGLGDAVLVAGKGDETIQDMGELKVHFSDRAQVVEALREWREGHH